jgi:hypothetical protein
MLFSLPSWATAAVTLAVIVLAVVRGQTTERFVAALTLAMLLWEMLQHPVYGKNTSEGLSHDGLMTLVLTLIALRSKRYWTIAAASVWLVTLATDVAQKMAPIDRWAFGTVELTWWYLFLACLAVGAWRTPRAQGTPAESALA